MKIAGAKEATDRASRGNSFQRAQLIVKRRRPILRRIQLTILCLLVCAVFPSLGRAQGSVYEITLVQSTVNECLDHVIVFHGNSLRRTLKSYFDYYHRSRTHLSLGKDAPEPRAIQPPEMGSVAAVPQVGGLHHRYERRAA